MSGVLAANLRGRVRPAVRSAVRPAVASLAAALLLSACGGPSAPESVQSGSSVTVAWSQSVRSLNASTVDATAGDREIAAATHRGFAELVEGTVQTDPSFGTVTVVKQHPFTVRYDLADPTWSDGIGVDGTDLLLAWAAGTDREAGFAAGSDDLARSREVVGFEEAERAIEVSFEPPEPLWQTALPVSVPAHVVGQRAFGVEDPMEAKKLVNEAIMNRDRVALAKLATVWNRDFAVADRTPAPALTVANGPYRVERIAREDAGQRVVLRANPYYAGPQAPTYERIVLRQTPEGERLDSLGNGTDIVQLTPTAKNRLPVRTLERREHHLSTTHDGTLWMVVIRGQRGTLSGPGTGERFLRSLPRDVLIEGGAGPWADAYPSTDSYLFDPGSADYQIAVEDSGFADRLGRPAKTSGAGAQQEPPRVGVCFGYDRSSGFARGAYRATARAMKEEGWDLRDCSAPGLDGLGSRPDADAVLVRVRLPRSPDDVAFQWGGDSQIPGLISNDREPLLKQFLVETERFASRDLRVQIERTIVDQQVAVPIALNSQAVLTVPQVSGVSLRPGSVAPLLSGAAHWSPSP